MEWLGEIGSSWRWTLQWLGVLLVVFSVLSKLMPCNPGESWWRDPRGFVTDLLYWFIVPIFLRLCRMWLLIAGIIFFYAGQEPRCLPVKSLPLWQQCVLVHLLQDVMLYWIHRVFHTGWAWKFHAIHHAPKILDFTAMARFHPVNNLLAFSLVDIVTILLGFAPETLVILTPINVILSAMVHANLNWTFGPFKTLVASPVFHRWHHTSEAEGLNKNFASTYPILDILFGTYYMPKGKVPTVYGISEPDFPEDFIGQLLFPFLPARSQTDASVIQIKQVRTESLDSRSGLRIDSPEIPENRSIKSA